MSKIPISKFKALILDDKHNGGCIEAKPYNGGSRRWNFPVSLDEMAAIAGQREVTDQRLRKFSFYRSLYYEGRISTKDKLLARCRRPHNRAMIKAGDLNGAVPHVYCKRKNGESRRRDDDDEEVSDEEPELEGIINSTHWVYIKIQLCKTDGYGVNSFPNGTESMSLTASEYKKILDHFEKFLAKKGRNYEVTPADEDEVISDLESDDHEDESAAEDEPPAKIQASKRQKGGRGAKGGKGKGGGKGGKGIRGKKRKGSEDDEDDANVPRGSGLQIC